MSSFISAGSSSLLEELAELNSLHMRANEFLRSLVDIKPSEPRVSDFSSFFPLPVDYFKGVCEPSVPNENILSWITSSGTLGVPSRIPLDRETSLLQMKAAASTFAALLGNVRRPLLIIDTAETLKSGGEHSARAAGSLAMLRMSSMHSWLLDDEANLASIISKYSRQKVKPFVFGFTSMVYQHLYERHIDLGQTFQGATLIHGGGWKKFEKYSVSRDKFYGELEQRYGFAQIVDYYGMAEQLGSIWLEAPNNRGVFLPNKYSGALIRDLNTLEVIRDLAKPGIIQLFSTIPRSYPGHSLLTGDLGSLELVNSNGAKLIGLRVLGRMPTLEPRGCSDAIIDAALKPAPDELVET